MNFTCARCGATISGENIPAHLKIEHGIEVHFKEWADGSPVIIDETLEPSDFELKEKT